MGLNYRTFGEVMKLQKRNNRAVNDRSGLEFSELKPDELGDAPFSIGDSLEPVSKFGDVLFLHRLSDSARNKFKVNFDNPGIVAVIE